MGTCWRSQRWVRQLVQSAHFCEFWGQDEGCRGEEVSPLSMWLLLAAHICKEHGTATAEARHLEKVL